MQGAPPGLEVQPYHYEKKHTLEPGTTWMGELHLITLLKIVAFREHEQRANNEKINFIAWV